MAVATACAIAPSCASAPAGPAPLVVLPPAPASAPRERDDKAATERASDVAGDDAPAPPIAWERGEAEARARARRLGAPLLVYVCADWAAASRAMDREVWTDPRVRAAARGLVALRLDVTDADLADEVHARRYDVRVVPTTLVIDDAGRRLAVVEGYAEAEAILGALGASL